MAQTYPGPIAPDPPLSSKQRAQAAKRAQLILESLEVGIAISLNDVHWLFDHTGYPRYTKSAEYMAARIVDTYKLDLITDRITS